MAGLIFRRVRNAMLLAAVLSGLASAAIASQTAGPQVPGASAGDSVALAQRYENGESVPRDYHRALTLYCQAAQRSTGICRVTWCDQDGVARNFSMTIGHNLRKFRTPDPVEITRLAS